MKPYGVLHSFHTMLPFFISWKKENIGLKLVKVNKSRYVSNDKQDTFHDLVPFVLFKKLEKHPWKSGLFSKVASFSP